MDKSIANYGNRKTVFDLLFDDFDRGLLHNRNMKAFESPVVDVRDMNDAYLMEVDLPGATEKDIDINIKDRVLTLRCKKERKDESKDGAYLLKERTNIEYVRSFNFSDNIDEEGITAVFENGVLEVRIPKKEEKKAHQIEVKKRT